MTRLILPGRRPNASGPRPDLGNTAWGDAASTHTVTTTVAAAIGEAHAAKRGTGTPDDVRRILVPPGTWTTRVGIGQYDSIQGTTDDPADTVLKWVTPPGGDPREYVFDVAGSVEYRNLTIHGGGQATYAIHDDADSGVIPSQVIARNCVFRGDYGACGFGVGTAGKEYYHEDCTFISYNGTEGVPDGNFEYGVNYFIHMNEGALRGSRLIFNRCTFYTGFKVAQINVAAGKPETVIAFVKSEAPDATAVELTVPAGEPAKIYVPEPFTPTNNTSTVIRSEPSRVPHWTDRDSAHNQHFGLYQ